ncbi:MAG: sugar phosphate isomerase [Spirochaetes bacterium]|nr:MAG: sugar phosphate isomerase [Spirochaetota bacterium]
MKKQSEYYKYTLDTDLRQKAEKEAARFKEEETQFQLGHLPTEQSHPVTVDFSQIAQKQPENGIKLLLEVDKDLPPVARKIFSSKSYNELVNAFQFAIANNKKVCFSGCGSTGRLSMMLEEMWRQYWEDFADVSPGYAARNPESDDIYLSRANLVCSIMTGGDRALIRAVENFEDYTAFGRRQVADLNLSKGDLLIAISEGGETSSVLGTIEEALTRGCQVFFAFNNPVSILTSTVERSRRIIENKDVVILDLYSGSMALSGSTRMQATTLEMLIIGSAIEESILKDSGEKIISFDRQKQITLMDGILESLSSPELLTIMADLAVRESDIYRAGGRVTYLASKFLLDIFSDTTERSPTFMLPPFRPEDDKDAPVSWAYAKDPTRSSKEAWFDMLRHAPRGLDWNSDDYKAMGAPQALIDNPPSLGSSEINRYFIGNEVDKSRTEKEPYLLLQILVGNVQSNIQRDCNTLWIGSPEYNNKEDDGVIYFPIKLPDSPIYLWHHIAVKLILNTISTASMGIMGRIRGNWMVQLDPTNKKLVDRGSRIISQLTGISYSKACEELHLSILAREELQKEGGDTTTSPVEDALDRLSLTT